MKKQANIVPIGSQTVLSVAGKSVLTGRIAPTDEDAAIALRNIQRLQRWCKAAGRSNRESIGVMANFVRDMAEFGPMK